MIALVLRPNATVAIAVETRHGLLGEQTEGFLEDWWGEYLISAVYPESIQAELLVFRLNIPFMLCMLGFVAISLATMIARMGQLMTTRI